MVDSKHFPNLFKPGQIGNVEIRNRIVMSPLGTAFWEPSGEVTERLVDHYVARAKGGTGLLTVSMVNPDYPPGYTRLGNLENPTMIERHCRLTERCHDYGAKVAIQICHMSGQTWEQPGGPQLVSSSAVPCIWLGEYSYPVPRALDRAEIYEIIERFAIIAANAKRAGYDFVALHGAHGYLITRFMSPHYNKRTDDFGGSLENRMRFPIEIIRRIKEVCGDDYPVGIRFSADEFLPDGVTIKESPIMAQMLEGAGADYIDVSSGTYENLDKSNDIMRLTEGWKAYIWEAVTKVVKVPTFASGGLKTPEHCEKVLAEGKAHYVSLGRPLFADPEWANKAKEGRVEDIRKCTSCLECLGVITGRAADSCCAINVAVGREKEFGDIKPAEAKSKVMIIGAGPGGMEAARVAALRGHDVALYDKKAELGGGLLLAAIPPGKDKLLWIRDYQATQLKKLNVTIKLGTEVSSEMVEKEKPDAVIVATGGRPLIPNIPGIKESKPLTAWDVLEGKEEVRNQSVIVAGGGLVGVETAEILCDKGNTVTVVEMLPVIAGDMEPLNRKTLMEVLQGKKITMLTEQEIVEVRERGIVVVDKKTGERKVIEGDRVILAMGVEPARELTDALEGKGLRVYGIGDCQEPRTIKAAVYEGASAATQI